VSPIGSQGSKRHRVSAARLSSKHAEDRGRRDSVEVPWRRPGARRTEFVCEGPIFDCGRPALLCVPFRESLEGAVVRHSFSHALDDEVDARQGH